jgi:hypothetical protein
LKPGGRFAVSDVVVGGDQTPAERQNLELWVACLAGALEEGAYRNELARAGFEAIDVEPTRRYRIADTEFTSAFIRARKPASAARSCCGPTCCSPALS